MTWDYTAREIAFKQAEALSRLMQIAAGIRVVELVLWNQLDRMAAEFANREPTRYGGAG